MPCDGAESRAMYPCSLGADPAYGCVDCGLVCCGREWLHCMAAMLARRLCSTATGRQGCSAAGRAAAAVAGLGAISRAAAGIHAAGRRCTSAASGSTAGLGAARRIAVLASGGCMHPLAHAVWLVFSCWSAAAGCAACAPTLCAAAQSISEPQQLSG